mgnify:CR=1 FL=1
MPNKTIAVVCQFLIEEVVCQYGCIGKIIAGRGELDAQEAEELFDRLGVKLSLTTAYNPEANGKVERRHGPIVKALVRACGDQVGNWPRLLPYALWTDRTMHSSVTGFMLAELMYEQKPIMPKERTIASWATVDWRDEMSREELLEVRICQLERRPEDVERATRKLRAARVKNKEQFDRTHRLRPKKIEEGDSVLVYDSSLDNQHKAMRKFARRWFGPYVVTSANNNGTYHLAELYGTMMVISLSGKRIKAFKKRHEDEPDPDDLDSDNDRFRKNGDPEDEE